MARKKITRDNLLEAYSKGYAQGREMEAAVHAENNICLDKDTARELYIALSNTFINHKHRLVHALLVRIQDV